MEIIYSGFLNSDSMNRITEITGSEGDKKSYTYDALGNETEYQYDVCDRLIEIRQYGAEGSLKEDTEETGMDADLLEAEKQNGRNRLCQVTRYTSDLRGQVTETHGCPGAEGRLYL